MRTRFLLSAVTLAAALGAGAAWACSCTGPSSAEEHVAATEVIFVGRAVRTVPERTAPEISRGDHVVTRFAVERTLKGQARPIRRIAHVANSSLTCGADYFPGQTYVVFASAYKGRLITSMCSGPQFPMAEYERALARESARPAS